MEDKAETRIKEEKRSMVQYRLAVRHGSAHQTLWDGKRRPKKRWDDKELATAQEKVTCLCTGYRKLDPKRRKHDSSREVFMCRYLFVNGLLR
jgi:hypothetical protein